MNNYCVICILNQVLRVADYINLKEEQTEGIFKKAMKKMIEIDFSNMTPPELAEKIYDVFSQNGMESDPYRKLRREQNDMILKKLDYFQNIISDSDDPLYIAGKYSLMGNIIDYGSIKLFNPDELFANINDIEIDCNDYLEFRRKLGKSKKILFITDNAGEAVLDMLFIKEIKAFNSRIEIVCAVRSKPAINDIIKEDAEYIGMNHYALILESGATFAGTLISKSTEEFKRFFFSADLIISKGQGNFETLEQEPHNILFLFSIKCPVISEYLNLSLGSLIFAFRDSI